MLGYLTWIKGPTFTSQAKIKSRTNPVQLARKIHAPIIFPISPQSRHLLKQYPLYSLQSTVAPQTAHLLSVSTGPILHAPCAAPSQTSTIVHTTTELGNQFNLESAGWEGGKLWKSFHGHRTAEARDQRFIANVNVAGPGLLVLINGIWVSSWLVLGTVEDSFHKFKIFSPSCTYARERQFWCLTNQLEALALGGGFQGSRVLIPHKEKLFSWHDHGKCCQRSVVILESEVCPPF